MSTVHEQIQNDINENKFMIFAKGEKGIPQCGFSATVMNIFEELGVDYTVKNVLADPELREGIKTFSNWPTIPQIYIGGEFIGGCDIAIEMFKNGDLKKKVQEAA
jgi:monothiol glutaredoxin